MSVTILFKLSCKWHKYYFLPYVSYIFCYAIMQFMLKKPRQSWNNVFVVYHKSCVSCWWKCPLHEWAAAVNSVTVIPIYKSCIFYLINTVQRCIVFLSYLASLSFRSGCFIHSWGFGSNVRPKKNLIRFSLGAYINIYTCFSLYFFGISVGKLG